MASNDHCVFYHGLCNCPLIDCVHMLNPSTAFTIHCVMSTVLYCEHFLWLLALTLITDKKPACS